MKKLCIVIILLLTACTQPSDIPTLHIFYNKTCGECQLLEEKFIPLVEDVEILLHDMDENESIEIYKEYLDTLENIDESLYDEPMTPFLYMENGFGAIGYTEVMNDIYLELIKETLQNDEYTLVPSGVWVLKEE